MKTTNLSREDTKDRGDAKGVGLRNNGVGGRVIPTPACLPSVCSFVGGTPDAHR